MPEPYTTSEKALAATVLFAGLVLVTIAADVLTGGAITHAVTRRLPVDEAELITRQAAHER
jgi:hypothetical protein